MVRVPRPQPFGAQEAGGICFCCDLRRSKFICFIALLTSGFAPSVRRKQSFYLRVVYCSVKNMCKYFVQSPI